MPTTDTVKVPTSILLMAIMGQIDPATAEITVTSDTTLDTLRFDSMDKVELAIMIEDKFNIPLDEALLPNTFGELVALIDLELSRR